MRLLGWVAKAVLFLLLAGFALKNSEMVTLRYFLGQEWSAPLSQMPKKPVTEVECARKRDPLKRAASLGGAVPNCNAVPLRVLRQIVA